MGERLFPTGGGAPLPHSALMAHLRSCPVGTDSLKGEMCVCVPTGLGRAGLSPENLDKALANLTSVSPSGERPCR